MRDWEGETPRRADWTAEQDKYVQGLKSSEVDFCVMHCCKSQ